MSQAEEEDEKGTERGLLSSLEGHTMRPSLLMTRYLESWGAAKPFAHLSHVDSPASTSTPLPVCIFPLYAPCLGEISLHCPRGSTPSLPSPTINHLAVCGIPELPGCPSQWLRLSLTLPSSSPRNPSSRRHHAQCTSTSRSLFTQRKYLLRPHFLLIQCSHLTSKCLCQGPRLRFPILFNPSQS